MPSEEKTQHVDIETGPLIAEKEAGEDKEGIVSESMGSKVSCFIFFKIKLG